MKTRADPTYKLGSDNRKLFFLFIDKLAVADKNWVSVDTKLNLADK